MTYAYDDVTNAYKPATRNPKVGRVRGAICFFRFSVLGFGFWILDFFPVLSHTDAPSGSGRVGEAGERFSFFFPLADVPHELERLAKDSHFFFSLADVPHDAGRV